VLEAEEEEHHELPKAGDRIAAHCVSLSCRPPAVSTCDLKLAGDPYDDAHQKRKKGCKQLKTKRKINMRKL
jgi:hypothetical protein